MGQIAAWPRYLAYMRESSYGSETPLAGTSVRRIDIASESLSSRPNRSEIMAERRISSDRVFESSRRSDGTVDLLPDFKRISHWIAHLMGNPVTTNPEAGVYVHTWIPNPQYQPWSMCLDTHPDLRVHRFPGASAKTLRVSTDGADFFRLGIGISSMSERYPTVFTIPLVDEADFSIPLSSGGPEGYLFSLGVSINDIGGFSSRGQFSASLTWSRKLRYASRSLEPIGIISDGRVSGQGNLKWVYDTDTIARHEAFRNLSKFGVDARWIGPQLGVFHNQQFEISMNCWTTDRGPNVRGSGGPGTLELDTDFHMIHDFNPNIDRPFRIKVTNSIPSPALLEI